MSTPQHPNASPGIDCVDAGGSRGRKIDGNPIIALEARLRKSDHVLTLGVRPNFNDYTAEEQRLIREAPKIYYPSSLYAELFSAAGKPIFPSLATYLFAQDKIKQTALFKLLGIPHPRTRVFYGKRQKGRISDHFELPFVAKVPRGSAMGRGVFLIRDAEELLRYCMDHSTAYIQEYLPIDRDMRIVVVGDQVVHAYWRIAPEDDHRSNVAAGGYIDLSTVPAEAKRLALDTAKACQWNDVGLDICCCNGRYFVLEANMKYGREGFRQADLDHLSIMEHLIANGKI
jgi:ribosomal protein S6--L-glutamate ligase